MVSNRRISALVHIKGDVYRSDAKIGRFLSVLALSGISYGLYRGINYLAEILHISAFEQGIVEFFRETPGFWWY